MGGKQLLKFTAATGGAFDAIGRGCKKYFAGFTAIAAHVFENRHVHSPFKLSRKIFGISIVYRRYLVASFELLSLIHI